jgi:hypothetical protein
MKRAAFLRKTWVHPQNLGGRSVIPQGSLCCDAVGIDAYSMTKQPLCLAEIRLIFEIELRDVLGLTSSIGIAKI